MRTALVNYGRGVKIAAAPRVLIIGLDPYRVPGPWDPRPVAEAIDAGLTKFAQHGVGVETCLVLARWK